MKEGRERKRERKRKEEGASSGPATRWDAPGRGWPTSGRILAGGGSIGVVDGAAPRRKISKGPEDSRDPDLELESYKNRLSTVSHQRCEKEKSLQNFVPKNFEHVIYNKYLQF